MFAKADPDWASKPDIKWNFTKFVIDRDGNVVARFEPTADMAEVEACVKALLYNKKQKRGLSPFFYLRPNPYSPSDLRWPVSYLSGLFFLYLFGTFF